MFAHRRASRTSAASGFYVFGSWVDHRRVAALRKRQRRQYQTAGPCGAFELLLRYSELDLNDAPVQGGKEHDWTLGANWYLTEHFKFQANYIRAYSDKGNLSLDPTSSSCVRRSISEPARFLCRREAI